MKNQVRIADLDKLFSNAHTLYPTSPTVLLYEPGEEYDGSTADERRGDLDFFLPDFGERKISGMALNLHSFQPELIIWMMEEER